MSKNLEALYKYNALEVLGLQNTHILHIIEHECEYKDTQALSFNIHQFILRTGVLEPKILSEWIPYYVHSRHNFNFPLRLSLLFSS